MIITFEEFRKIKDSLPDGSMKRIAELMEMDVETVRNYFGGANYQRGQVTGIHYEKGNNGGWVRIEDETILDCALGILKEAGAEKFPLQEAQVN